MPASLFFLPKNPAPKTGRMGIFSQAFRFPFFPAATL